MKHLEIRDHATCIPAVAWRIGEEIDPRAYGSRTPRHRTRRIYARAGYGPSHAPEQQDEYVFLCRLSDGYTTTDPYKWSSGRTMQVAHEHLRERWDTVRDGDVIDVRFLLGEATAPAETDL